MARKSYFFSYFIKALAVCYCKQGCSAVLIKVRCGRGHMAPEAGAYLGIKRSGVLGREKNVRQF